MKNILADRYASPEMSALFSPLTRAKVFREAWANLAVAQKKVGVDITQEQVDELFTNTTVTEEDLEVIAKYEAELKHDVMAHLKRYAEVCPIAAPVLHLGATSCFVTDNADAVLYIDALQILHSKLLDLIQSLSKRIIKDWKDLPCLGYTHFQPAQTTTMAKRAGLWLQDLVNDHYSLEEMRSVFPIRGVKGTTGTQASFKELLGNKELVDKMEIEFVKGMGSLRVTHLSGQTLPRKLEAQLADVIAGIGVTLCKIGNDVRLLSHTGELREGFGKNQVGSSAMPFKRNPMKAERLCSLSRTLPKYREMITEMAMNQWLERSLDDSAVRRVAFPDMFLAADGALRLALRLVEGLEADEDIIDQRLAEEELFLASEILLIRGVKNGGCRQELHQKLRDYAIMSKESGNKNHPASLYFLNYIMDDPELSKIWHESAPFERAEIAGLAEQQVIEYYEKYVESILEQSGRTPPSL